MPMLKKILRLLLGLLLTAYLVLGITAFSRLPADRLCTGLTVVVRDSTARSFVSRSEIDHMLSSAGVPCVGCEMDSVNTRLMEETLTKHPLIERVECYKTPDDRVCVELYQRIPILRVMSSTGEDYYVDHRGGIMPADTRCLSHLPVATGRIEKSFAQDKLYRFALFLQKNEFWRSQIEQINVVKGGNIELVPRVGDHIIYIGQAEDVESKLQRVRYFYDKGLSRVGWDRYSRINVEFGNQIICTRK